MGAENGVGTDGAKKQSGKQEPQKSQLEAVGHWFTRAGRNRDSNWLAASDAGIFADTGRWK